MLLSICIPTRNRADVLQQSLQSIVSQSAFVDRNDIEIVICDNASDDRTGEVANAFSKRFKGKIHYHRNQSDLEDRNFEKSLRHGQGNFLKLANDSLSWQPGSLDTMIRMIETTAAHQPTLFFLNKSRTTKENIVETFGIENFLLTVSYFCTWIGSFGIWKNQLDELSDFSRYAALKLTQVDVLLRTLEKNKMAYVCNLPFFQIIPTGPKGGYNIAEVFGKNYLQMLRNFGQHISENTMAVLKKEVLEKHIIPFYVSGAHNFGDIDIEKELTDYEDEPYFKPLISKAMAERKNLDRQTFVQQAPTLWRKRNPHNQTVMRSLFNFEKVQVGQATYGPLNIQEWGHPDEQLNIGHYVSISEGVTFLLGGNHPHQGITTFPVKVKFLGHAQEAQTKGAITVGDDVWLGHNAMVMSGVTISQGAVVAAGAVVTRDVPPYAIVAGNPARIVKYRFSENIIQELQKINYAKISPAHMAEIGLDLYESCETKKFEDSLQRLIEISTLKNIA